MLETITSDKRLTVISDANGAVVMDVSHSGAKTIYFLCEIDGRIWSSDAVDWSA